MTRAKNDLTPEAVRRLLSYDPHLGVWQYRERAGRRPRGWFAGALDPKTGYRRIQIGTRKYLAHRLAWLWMKGVWPRDEIDHRDLDKANNRWANLREATRSQNVANSAIRSTNKSGFKGVTFKNGRWRATILVDRRSMHLGYFMTAEEASEAYREASERFHGEHGRLQ